MRLSFLLLPALWLLATAPAEAAPPRGATSCTGCHPRTASKGPVPTLTGRPADDIITQMNAFKTGERQSTVMVRIAKGFSDEEIHALADWFASGGTASPAQPVAPAAQPQPAQP